MKDSRFYKSAELAVRLLPAVLSEECFALKGGTAINFFFREMPRLSVDLDLNYLPLQDRKETLEEISRALKRIAQKIKKQFPSAHISEKPSDETKGAIKLVVTVSNAPVKIEPNVVFRGQVFAPIDRKLCKTSSDLFELSVKARTMSFEDLYAGKICAALSRQHPRDLFDMKILFENEGITPKVRKAFVVYLASDRKPMHQLLNPQRLDVSRLYEIEFHGMRSEKVPLQELYRIREHLIETLRDELSTNERKFLLSIKTGTPKWDLLDLPGIEALPSLKWKLENIGKMNPDKKIKDVDALKACLEL